MIGGALIGAARGARVAASVAGHAAFTASRGVFKIALHVIEGVATRNTPTKKTKFKWDHVLHRYGEGRARALRIARDAEHAHEEDEVQVGPRPA